MKVGILTYHDGPNHGAFLQAYATCSFLKSLGFESVSIINYKNRKHAKQESWKRSFRYRNPFAILGSLKKHYAFAKSRKALPLTGYTTNPLEVVKRHFDVVIVGSDVVWNYNIFGYDDLFFGGVNAGRIISYAASFGWVKESDDHPFDVLQGLGRFSAISVRDSNSKEIVRRMLKVSVPVVLDPTFLISWREHECSTARIRRLRPYLLVYAYKMSLYEVSRVAEYAKKNGLITIAVGYRQKWCDKVWVDVGPFEWLALYSNAKHVVTGTYHGTIFSILYRKPFNVCMNDKIKTRVLPLLDMLNAQEVILREGEEFGVIDYDSEKLKFLDKEVDLSRDWLRETLEVL